MWLMSNLEVLVFVVLVALMLASGMMIVGG